MTEEFKPIVIIPTYNEAENIKPLINEIFEFCPDIEIMIVDDNSPDNTAEIAQSLCNKQVRILKRSKKSGLAPAYIEGYKKAIEFGYNAFIQMDADFSHNPSYLPFILQNLKKYDFLVGSRNVKGGKSENWGFIRTLISKAGSFYARALLSCPIKDLTGGYNAYKKEVIEKIGLNSIISSGYCFQIEMKYRAYKNGFKYLEFPIVFQNRENGVSKMSLGIFFEAFKNVLKIRFLK